MILIIQVWPKWHSLEKLQSTIQHPHQCKHINVLKSNHVKIWHQIMISNAMEVLVFLGDEFDYSVVLAWVIVFGFIRKEIGLQLFKYSFIYIYIYTYISMGSKRTETTNLCHYAKYVSWAQVMTINFYCLNRNFTLYFTA